MNEDLYEEALKAIQALFNDMSVSQREAKQNIQGLIDDIEILIDSLGEI